MYWCCLLNRILGPRLPQSMFVALTKIRSESLHLYVNVRNIIVTNKTRMTSTSERDSRNDGLVGQGQPFSCLSDEYKANQGKSGESKKNLMNVFNFFEYVTKH